MSLWLNEDELVELTGYRQRSRQRQALAELGVKFRTRPADGFPLVLRDQFLPAMDGKKGGPDWAAAGV
jgi:hypothetical protein